MPHCVCVCAAADCFWTRSSGREVKTHHPNVSQSRQSLATAQGLCALGKNLEHPLMRRWHFLPAVSSPLTPGGCCMFFFPPSSCRYRGRCQYLGLASLLAVKTQSGFWLFTGLEMRKCRSRRGWSPSEERKGKEGGPSGDFFFFVPFLQQQIGKPTPALSLYAVTVLFFCFFFSQPVLLFLLLLLFVPQQGFKAVKV